MVWLAVAFALAAGIVIGLVVASRLAPRPAPTRGATPVPAERPVRAEHDRVRMALDTLPVGVIVADADGAVLVRNGRATRMIGSWRGDVLIDEAAAGLMTEALAGREARRTLELYGPPRRVVAIRALPITGADGGAVIIIDDITERARIDAVRTDFVANISHELKTPVGALSVLAEALADAEDPDDVRRLSAKVVREADRLSHIIDDLLELSRIELGGEPVREPVDLEVVIHGAVERIGALAERHGIRITIEPVPATCRVLGDRRQLLSALSNLVDNAVKYSEPGGGVEISTIDRGGEVEIVVADHGIGIPERDLDRVFERFYRVDRARSRETGGTGLGLSIVRHVATNHGGRVTVSSTEGEGSQFRLVVPTTPAA